MEIKKGDWIVVTRSTLDDDLNGLVMQVVKVDKSDSFYPYSVQVPNETTRWANGIPATELMKALA